MPREKNKPLRILVPLIALLVGIVVIAAIYQTNVPTGGSGAATPPQGGEQPAAANLDQREGEQDATTGADEAPVQRAASDQPEQSPAARPESPAANARRAEAPAEQEPDRPRMDAPPEGAFAGPLRARVFDPSATEPAPIPGDDQAGFVMRVRFTLAGAGVQAITLTEHSETWRGEEAYTLQERRAVVVQDAPDVAVASLAARALVINDAHTIDLFSRVDGPRWRETGPGAFEAFIVDAEDRPVLRLTRSYVLTPGSYEIRVDQRVENLTSQPIDAQWIQYGPVDLPASKSGYIRDMRRVHFAQLLPEARDPSRQFVEATGYRSRQSIVDAAAQTGGSELLWESASDVPPLVWAALTNRYFAFAVHSDIDVEAAADAQPIEKAFAEVTRLYAVTLQTPGEPTLVMQMTSPTKTIEARRTLDLSLGAYAGPLARKSLRGEPLARALRLDHLIIYTLGGPCAWCTFQWLARILISFLGLLHDYVLFDWSLAIMALVVCVRALLHPITKRSQISLQRFSRQMQRLAPKQQKLREKYKDDPKRLQQEMAKLMREEGVNVGGALGCLPMFLQSPIWIALYAMLFFAFELRHEAAFFGLFQGITGGSWSFMADLSAPDRLVDFGRTLFSIPLLGDFGSFNILPLLLGVVFFLQQKYLTPPPSASLTPEQETQQKIVKVMLVGFFPIILYNAPSGLALYFITNSVLGILESRYIRAHVDQMDLDKPKTPAPAAPSRKKVQNVAPGAPKRGRQREGTPYKRRGKR